ncbi:MAG: hypothetical protein S4CHLAM20_14020 [Chlamydiia bacterium]|nr:hypothetical protein [Chlamydiia bacterium]
MEIPLSQQPPTCLEKAEMGIKSAFINFAASTALGTVLGAASIVVLAVTLNPLAAGLLFLAAVICGIYAVCHQKARPEEYWSEFSDLFNIEKFGTRNLTIEQAQDHAFPLGSDGTCYYHPIDFIDIKDDETNQIHTRTIFQGAQPKGEYNHHNILLNRHNVRSIVNLTEEEEELPNIFSRQTIQKNDWANRNVTVYQHNVRDFTTPTVDDLKEAIEDINTGLQSGNLMIHCKSGVGRSSCLSLAWLLERNEDWTIGKAKQTLLSRRISSNIDKPKITELLLNFRRDKKDTEYTLEEEINARIKEINKEENLSQDELRNRLRKEYRGMKEKKTSVNTIITNCLESR